MCEHVPTYAVLLDAPPQLLTRRPWPTPAIHHPQVHSTSATHLPWPEQITQVPITSECLGKRRAAQSGAAALGTDSWESRELRQEANAHTSASQQPHLRGVRCCFSLPVLPVHFFRLDTALAVQNPLHSFCGSFRIISITPPPPAAPRPSWSFVLPAPARKHSSRPPLPHITSAPANRWLEKREVGRNAKRKMARRGYGTVP